VQAYLGMLKGGCSKPPLELLKGAGVDLTTPAPIEAAMKTFARTLDEVDQLLANQNRRNGGGKPRSLVVRDSAAKAAPWRRASFPPRGRSPTAADHSTRAQSNQLVTIP
jgi:hypothetical protein